MTFLFDTWKEFEAATPEEWRLEVMLWLRTWENNHQDQEIADTKSDHSAERSAWIDEYTELGGYAERIRQAGKLTTVRNSHSKATKG